MQRVREAAQDLVPGRGDEVHPLEANAADLRIVGAGLDQFVLLPEDRRLLGERLEALWRQIDEAPKSRRWKLRDRVGDRVRWYEEPEEVG